LFFYYITYKYIVQKSVYTVWKCIYTVHTVVHIYSTGQYIH